jgi:DNA uptake protein ComE-like DNA-binding protein
VWSLGFLAFVPFLILAVARGRWKDWQIFSGYVVAVAAEITAVSLSAHSSGPGSVAAGFLVLALMGGGASHAFADHDLTRPGTTRPGTAGEANEQAMAAAHARMKHRDEAREIAAKDPVLRSELRIGRPDLTRSYDDGGLVDVNQVPSWVLSSHLGLSPQEAAAVVAARANLGRFVSPAEVSQYAQLAPDRLDAIQDWMIFS